MALLAALMLIGGTAVAGLRGIRNPVVAEAVAAPVTPRPAATDLPVVVNPLPSPTGPLATATGAPVDPAPVMTETPAPTPTPARPLVAVLAGHRQNDSGAICEGGPYDGLQEVQVTTDIVARLVPLLNEKGYEVLDLDEFDTRLAGLRGAALVALHVDSCVEWEGTSGYKVARSAISPIPEVEDRLVDCLSQEYAAATGLTYHEGSITHAMTNYHVFRRIDPATPAVIIELGFLFYDHELLTERQEVVVEGLLRGIGCFMDSQALTTPP